MAAAALVAGCSSQSSTIEPLTWEKVPGPGPNGAVLGLGSAGAFDEVGNFTISAFKDGATYRLYYGGADVFGDCPGSTARIGASGLRPRTTACTGRASRARKARAPSSTTARRERSTRI